VWWWLRIVVGIAVDAVIAFLYLALSGSIATAMRVIPRHSPMLLVVLQHFPLCCGVRQHFSSVPWHSAAFFLCSAAFGYGLLMLLHLATFFFMPQCLEGVVHHAVAF